MTPYGVAAQQSVQEDMAIPWGLVILGVLIPLAGLISWIYLLSTGQPKKAATVGWSSLASFFIQFIIITAGRA